MGTDSPTDRGLRESLERKVRDHDIFGWLGIDVLTAEDGRVVLELPRQEKFGDEAIHGGVTATVLDTASGFALRTTFADPYDAELATTDLNVRYVRPARNDLLVEATVVRAEGGMGYTDAEARAVHDGEERLIATGGASYRLFRE